VSKNKTKVDEVILNLQLQLQAAMQEVHFHALRSGGGNKNVYGS
jgi:hypothetical protein